VKTAFILFAHGSSIASANDAVRSVARSLADTEAAFLEQGRPSLEEAVAALAAQGATRIAVIPYFLTLGLHMQRDLPRLAQEAARQNGGVEIQVTSPLDGHPALLEALLDRASEALAGKGRA